MKLHEKLKNTKLLFDGAFGTYYAKLYDTKTLPELANTQHPQRVADIHKEYIAAGADIIRTNTFACNTVSFGTDWTEVCKNLRAGYRLAKQAAAEKNVYVAADIGPIPYIEHKKNVAAEYINIAQTFLDEGADIFVFETFSDIEDLEEAIAYIGEKAFVIVQFHVNQYGYSQTGRSARSLLERAQKIKSVDAVGLNCGVGPGHMLKIIQSCSFADDKFVAALPNAGYPQYTESRMVFDDKNIDYFVSKMQDIVNAGADFIGGCCGTNPNYIRKIKSEICLKVSHKKPFPTTVPTTTSPKIDSAFFADKPNKKLIAVELAPPVGCDDQKLMEAAHLLKQSGADVLTFPDSPSGRTRADSVLMAEKVSRETGLTVMPHLCCRDKNAIAMRSQILGAYINHIRNFLVVTGDPIPSVMRDNAKNVFHFDSVRLMRMMQEMDEEEFVNASVCYGGAINQGRKNIAFEVERIKRKTDAGASFFMTQPILSHENAQRVRYIKEQTGARILCGIMPFVSLKNAMFMKNEMTGIDVDDTVLSRFSSAMTREDGENAGVALAAEMIDQTYDFADGYYFSFPFNRVHMLEKIRNLITL